MQSELFDLKGKVCIITGGGGLLGKKHAEAVLIGNGIPVLVGRTLSKLEAVRSELSEKYDGQIEVYSADITDKSAVLALREYVMEKYGHIDVLINNAANNPKVEEKSENMKPIRFESFPEDIWNADIKVGLTGALFCCQIFGEQMLKQGGGVILNISSDYGILAPDQRLYLKDGLADDMQIVKPVTYSVVKHGLIGLTKYLATYWGDKGIRSNTLCPSGIYNGQDEIFVEKFVKNVPMGRMSMPEEYIGTILYMISDASSFMNGATVVIDGGKSIW